MLVWLCFDSFSGLIFINAGGKDLATVSFFKKNLIKGFYEGEGLVRAFLFLASCCEDENGFVNILLPQ